MAGLGGWHVLMLLAVALLLFGGSGKISSIMGDVAKGINLEDDMPIAPRKPT